MGNFFKSIVFRTIVIAAIVFVLFIVLVNKLLAVGTQHGQEIVVPDFANMTYQEAVQVAKAAELEVILSDSVFIRKMRPGAVYMQTPKAGSNVKRGRRVRLITNTMAPKEVAMPALVGCSLRQAKAELLRSGLVLGRISYTPDIATNIVLRQQRYGRDVENGAPIPSGTTINLVLGLNSKEALTTVPNLIGQTYQKAIDALQDGSLNPGQLVFDSTVKDYADTLASQVYSQRPMPYTGEQVVRGADIALYFTLDTTKVVKVVQQTIEYQAQLDSLLLEEIANIID